jgi:nucleoid-associated protein YgaU
MAGTIGIKIANGDFYPIIEENSPVKRRLVLTTVHDKQSNVQIDLFRSISKSMLDAQYIGSLLVETSRAKPKGEPSIEMIISADMDGNINAEAYDLDAGPNGERHVLNVSLQNIDSLADIDNPPDFEFNSRSYHYDEKKTVHDRRFPWLILVIATLFVALAIAALWYFFLGGSDVFSTASARSRPETRPSNEYSASPPPARQETQPIREPTPLPPLPNFEPEPEPVVIRAPTTPAAPSTVQRVRPPAPVMSYKVPAVIPRNGVVYQIQWGDTLWDISAAFYRNPWLYPRIARDNRIRNPDLIIAGSNLRIMPK